jgi:hypothetical protein
MGKELMIQATKHKSKSWEKQKERKRTNSEVIIGEFHLSPMGLGTAPIYIVLINGHTEMAEQEH